MPRHNLNEHLQWLLSEKPFIAPAIPLVSYDPDAPTSSATLSQNHSFLADFAPNNEPAIPGPTTQPITRPTRSVPPVVETKERLPAGGSAADMARLRATPANGKPRLMLAEVPPHGLPSATPGKLRRALTHGGELEPSTQGPSTPLIPPSSERSMPRKQRAQTTDIEAIDLTGDSFVASSPSPTRANKGRKRKSQDLEADLRVAKSPRPRRPTRSSSPDVLEEDGFANIDDIMLPPESPPPPYSTAVVRSHVTLARPQAGRYVEDDFELALPQGGEDQLMADIEVQPASRKRKPLSRAPSETCAPPQKIGRPHRSPSPQKLEKQRYSPSPRKIEKPLRSPSPQKIRKQTHSPSPLKVSRPVGVDRHPQSTSKRRIGTAVLDSEDEFDGFDDLDGADVYLGSEPESPQPPQHEIRKTIGKEACRKQDVPGQSLAMRPSQSPFKISSPRRPQQEPIPVTAPLPPPEKIAPTKEESTVIPGTPLSRPVPPSSELSKQERDRMRKIVETFLKAEGRRLKRISDEAHSTYTEAKANFFRQLEEHGLAQPGEKEILSQYRARGQALEQLIALKTKHEHLNMQRQEIVRKIHDDIDNDEHDEADGARLNQVSKSITDIVVQICNLLEPAGMNQYLHSATLDKSVEGASEVMVQSTQVTPALRDAKPSVNAGPSHIPQTQYVKQPHTSAQDIGTPKRRIRFVEEEEEEDEGEEDDDDDDEEEEDTVASPPRMNITTRTRHDRTSPSNNAKSKSKPQDRSHRVPETPQRRRSPMERDQVEVAEESDELDSFHTPEGFDEFDPDLVQHNMGSPPLRIDNDDGNDDDYCDDDDDDFIDELANIENETPDDFDWRGDKVSNREQGRSREAFQETSVNRVRQQTQPISPKRPQLNQPGMNYPWSFDVRNAIIGQFHLRGFRPGQLEAINTTLNGEHCFVLMPTGGGKSLCYQLPSVVNSGKTQGVTIVVSPLLSLMEDQVEACKQRFGIQAFLINGESTTNEKAEIMSALQRPEPQKFIQLLYVTPEMLSKNQRMINILSQLHRKQRLARIVIDEAHCVSQWGHDFRPDYKALGDVVQQFSGVPILALTATATKLVRTDVMANLGIRGCRQFSQSFNRPNLSYEVVPKGRGVVASIATLIKSKYNKKCGIVYCLSRKNCESVAEKLTEMGIQAYHYHAGMQPAERSDVQRKWQSNEYHVIVATIAFGMGIDKADVRFVIHHTLPKSLEGYYQETGRAGRDGKHSHCYLYYLYADCRMLRMMIKEGDGSREQKERQYNMLRNVIQFCENKTDCRRAQVLNYFSESFNRENCNATCDNCKSTDTFEEQDLTPAVAAAVALVRNVEKSNATMLQCVDAFRGAKGSKLKAGDVGQDDEETALYGRGANLERGVVERLFQHLLDDGTLKEVSKTNRSKFAVSYLRIGKGGNEYAQGRKKCKLYVRVNPLRSRAINPDLMAAKPKKKKVVKNRTEYPSTNISSPVQPQSRDIQKFAFQDNDNDDDDDDEDYFEEALQPARGNKRNGYQRNGSVVPDEVAVAKPSRASKSSTCTTKRSGLGAPITTDDRVAGLNEFQRDILEDFLAGAKAMARNIMMKQDLRVQPFSDTVLREMGLDLPMNEKELLAIPGVIPEMARVYGKTFLKLIKNTRHVYGEQAPIPKNQLSRGRRNREAKAPYDDDEEQRPLDPNHRVVVDLVDLVSSEAEEDSVPFAGNESDYSFGDGDEDESVHVSHHFTQHQDTEVQAFNNRISQLQTEKSAAVAKAGASKSGGSKKSLPKGRTLPWEKEKRQSGGYGSKNYGGVTKKKGSKRASSSRPSGAFWGAKRASGGGNRGGKGGAASGIAAMPT